MATILVVGATGMTGRSLVEQLLDKNHKVRVIVRTPHKLSAEVRENPNTTIVQVSVLDLSDEEMTGYTKDCDAVVSCLGHVLNFKGMFGEPKKLCTEATRRLCEAIEKNSPAKLVKFILMNTVGVRNPGLEEKRTWFERGLLTLLRHTVPPHRDNETVAGHLLHNVNNKSRHIDWCVVRPDSLINAAVSGYEIKESPSTGILTARPTTRSNVAHFMTDLIENVELWNTWKSRMPVIMNVKV